MNFSNTSFLVFFVGVFSFSFFYKKIQGKEMEKNEGKNNLMSYIYDIQLAMLSDIIFKLPLLFFFEIVSWTVILISSVIYCVVVVLYLILKKDLSFFVSIFIISVYFAESVVVSYVILDFQNIWAGIILRLLIILLFIIGAVIYGFFKYDAIEWYNFLKEKFWDLKLSFLLRRK